VGKYLQDNRNILKSLEKFVDKRLAPKFVPMVASDAALHQIKAPNC